MSVEQFLRDLEQPQNADIEPVEKKFMEQVKDRIQAVTETYDEKLVEGEEAWLRAFHKDFFDFSVAWVKQELQENAGRKNHPDAAPLKQDAQAMISGLQTNIIEFALCYMKINRFITLLRDEIKKEEIRMGSAVGNMNWSSDLGDVIAKHRGQKRRLLGETEQLGEARVILEKAEVHFGHMNKALVSLFGSDKATTLMRSYFSGLRIMDDVRIRKALRAIKETKKKFSVDQKSYKAGIETIEKAAADIQGLLEENREVLTDQDGKFYLKPMETDLAYNGKIEDLKKIKGFLAKYHLPYMQFKLDSLARLKEKMLVVGSLESLMTLYRKLLSGLAQPLTSLEEVRAFENDAVNPAKYLVSGHFQEIPNIWRDAQKAVQEFRDGRKEFEEIEKMELQTIEEGGSPKKKVGS